MNQLIKNEKPAYLANVEDIDNGLGELNQHIVPPRLKIVQPTSRVGEDFREGDVLLMPQELKITGLDLNEKGVLQRKGQPFLFTPLFFYVEYCAWNPIELKTAGAIREHSFDKNSEVARRARDFNLRSVACPEVPGKFITYKEHLNFLWLLHVEGLQALPVLQSFSGAEHKAGTNFASLIKMRMAPLYSLQFQAAPAYRENDKGKWYGLDITNPHENLGGFVSEEMFHITKRMYEELKAAHEARNIKVEHTYDDEDDVTTFDGQVVNSEL